MTLEKGSYIVKKMLVPIFVDGKCVYKKKTIKEMQEHFKEEIKTLYDDNRRLTNPKEIFVDLSQKLYDKKIALLQEYL